MLVSSHGAGWFGHIPKTTINALQGFSVAVSELASQEAIHVCYTQPAQRFILYVDGPLFSSALHKFGLQYTVFAYSWSCPLPIRKENVTVLLGDVLRVV